MPSFLGDLSIPDYFGFSGPVYSWLHQIIRDSFYAWLPVIMRTYYSWLLDAISLCWIFLITQHSHRFDYVWIFPNFSCAPCRYRLYIYYPQGRSWSGAKGWFVKDFWKIKCMLRKAQQGAKRPLDQLGVLGGAVSPQAGFGAAPRKILKILKIWCIKSSISVIFFNHQPV